MRASSQPLLALSVVFLVSIASNCTARNNLGYQPDGSNPADTGSPGEVDCSAIPVPSTHCLRGSPIFVCEPDATGHAAWIPTCPNVEQGGTTGTGGSSATSGRGGVGGSGGASGGASGGGTGGAAGRGGSSGGAGPVDGGAGASPCTSTSSCAPGQTCTTEDGACNAPPGCGAGVGCPAVCYGTCRAAVPGPTCGSAQCAEGMVCCNSSCGICTRPNGACTKQLCTGQEAPLCGVDGDCRLAADYCKGCDCRVLGPGQALPACNGPGVNCFADACLNKAARCVNGTCVVQ